MHMENKGKGGYKQKPVEPWDVNPFDKVKAIVKTEVLEEPIEGQTKEQAKENFYKRFHKLEKKYGEGFVKAAVRSVLRVKDAEGNIAKWVITTKFYCYIPRKKIENETR